MTPAPSFDLLTLSLDGTIARLTLHRPERLNALSVALMHEIVRAARWLDESDAVKVVVVAGAGRSFCAGFDLDDFATRRSAAENRTAADVGRIMADAITDMRPLSIAVIRILTRRSSRRKHRRPLPARPRRSSEDRAQD